ncbi:MAG: hypothetical protein Q8M07_14390 [Prosthecobacter sp.]|nr:hypothetical protein [Prosthecobacter sp.]
MSVGGGGAGGNGSGGAGGAGGGGGLPPYVDPYPEPWPDFEAAAAADANKDSDNDGVPDMFDAVWYDPKFKHPRSGFPHYNIIDLGKCEGGFIDMADNGAMVWQENSYYDATASLKIWTPSQPQGQSFTFDPNAFGLEDGRWGGVSNISEAGTLTGLARQEKDNGYYEDRYFSLGSDGSGAAWLPELYPDEGAHQEPYDHWQAWSRTAFGPQQKLFGTTSYTISDENYSSRVSWLAFFNSSGGSIVFEDKTLHADLPELPEDPPDPDLEPWGTRVELSSAGIYHEKDVITGSGGGVVRSTRRTERELDAVAGEDIWGGTYWSHAAHETYYGYRRESWNLGYHPVNAEDSLTYTLVTAAGTHDLVVQDLLDEPATFRSFHSVSPAPQPWVSTRIDRYTTLADWYPYQTEAFIYKPVGTGGAYEPCAIYAGFEDYQADKPIAGIGLLTAQGQAIVHGDFDLEQEGDEVGLWADGEVQTIDKVISGYEHYLHDPADWQHPWQFHDVSRDGMIAATAWKQGNQGPEPRMLLLIPVTTREILADGSISPTGGGVQTSMPSPVFCASVAEDGTPAGQMTCALENPRVLADGSIVGDLKVKAEIVSRACDNVKGAMGTITQAQLWVNGADTPQAVIPVDASDKQPTGTRARPYPFTGKIKDGNNPITIPNVPLTAGVNTFKFTAHDPVYGIPGYSTWAATITVADPTEDDGGGVRGLSADLEGLTLSVELPAATLLTRQ